MKTKKWKRLSGITFSILALSLLLIYLAERLLLGEQINTFFSAHFFLGNIVFFSYVLLLFITGVLSLTIKNIYFYCKIIAVISFTLTIMLGYICMNFLIINPYIKTVPRPLPIDIVLGLIHILAFFLCFGNSISLSFFLWSKAK